jgi:hypothetical protein
MSDTKKVCPYCHAAGPFIVYEKDCVVSSHYSEEDEPSIIMFPIGWGDYPQGVSEIICDSCQESFEL